MTHNKDGARFTWLVIEQSGYESACRLYASSVLPQGVRGREIRCYGRF